MEVVVRPIVDGGDAPEGAVTAAPGALGEEVHGLRMLEERVLGPGQQGPDIHAERGDPHGIPPVQSIG